MVDFKEWCNERWCGLARYIRAIIFTFLNFHSLYTSFIAMVAVYVTSDRVLDIQYKVDTFFLGLGITFPLIFSIQAAFGRREQAARSMANLKAHALAFYLMHRDWEKPEPGNLSTVGDNSRLHATEARDLLRVFLENVRQFLLRKNHGRESMSEMRWWDTSFKNSWLSMLLHSKVRFSRKKKLSTFNDADLVSCYQALSRLSIINEKALVRWGYLKSGESPTASRLQLTLTNLIVEFEQLRNIRDYRTPVMLRYGNKVLVHIMSVLLGPYFNTFCHGVKDPALDCYVSYIVAFLFVICCTVLTRISKDLEVPFDYEGMDDLFFDIDTELDDFTSINVGGVDDLFVSLPPTVPSSHSKAHLAMPSKGGMMSPVVTMYCGPL